MLCRFPCLAPPRCTLTAVYFLWHFPWLNRATFEVVEALHASPLALPGALPFTLRSREGSEGFTHSCSSFRHRTAGWCPDFPPAQPSCDGQASDHPAHPLF